MSTVHFGNVLRIGRCPHCNVDNPHLSALSAAVTSNSEGGAPREWRMYGCARCGGVVTASKACDGPDHVLQLFPSKEQASDKLPTKARSYLQQAMESLHAPAGSIMLTAAALDAMLKAKGYFEGGLYERIEKAASDHLITADMAKWAHQVRLEANGQRHADENADLPVERDAQRCIQFARAFGQFIFELPALVEEGLKESQPKAAKKE